MAQFSFSKAAPHLCKYVEVLHCRNDIYNAFVILFSEVKGVTCNYFENEDNSPLKIMKRRRFFFMFSDKTSVPVSVYLLGPMVISSSSYYNLVIIYFY